MKGKSLKKTQSVMENSSPGIIECVYHDCRICHTIDTLGAWGIALSKTQDT